MKLVWVGLACCAALGQVTGGEATFRADIKEVLIPVVVHDPDGHAIGGLKASDFQIFDKGKRQTISSFRAIGPSGSEEPGSGSDSSIPFGRGAAEPLRLGAANTQGPQPGRSVVYVFDDLNTGFAEFARMREAAGRHFQAGLPPGELAAVRSFSGSASVAFTNDAAKVADTVQSLRASLSTGHGEANPCPYVSFYLADSIVRRNNAEALEAATQQTMNCTHLDHDRARNIAESAAKREMFLGEQDTRLGVRTLQAAIRSLQEQPEPRVLVLASAGFYAQTPNGQKALADTLDLAARAHVTINALQARGIYVAGGADASRASAPSALEQRYYRSGAIAEEGTLEDLAHGTGGDYFHNNNDLTKGFRVESAAPNYWYVLGFSPIALKPDGSFHALKIRVTDGRSVRIEARPGYYAPRRPSEGSAGEAVTEEIDEAVLGRDERTDIPIDAATQVTRTGTAPARVSVLTKIHLKPVQFRELKGRNHAVLTVVAVVFDSDGAYLTGARNTVNLMLPGETLAVKDPAANVQMNFQMEPGKYRIRVVVGENENGSLSTRDIPVLVR